VEENQPLRLSIADWHKRFIQQALWTHGLRRYLYDRAGLASAKVILEVGCGTGALLPELIAVTGKPGEVLVSGLDINRPSLVEASRHAAEAALVQGDAHSLPYASHRYDLCLCHFLLLWTANPVQVVQEMKRVTRPGGAVLVLAEPDYGGRIDFPDDLSQLGELQKKSLQLQGANPQLGRRLAGIMAQTGLTGIEFGVLGGQWSGSITRQEWESEWAVLRLDLAGLVDQAEIERLSVIDRAAWSRGERVLFVPTFYAWGRVPL
jgi:SAM-dependent methyltransferase